MSDLICIAFDGELKAEEMRLDLMKMKHQRLVDFEEAAIVVRRKDGKVRLHHVAHMTGPGAVGGGFIGMLAGLIVFNPLLALIGMAGGAVAGAAAGALREVGIEEDFMEKLASCLKPGSSAIFILVRQADPEAMRDELKKYNGKLLYTSLKHEDQAKLRQVLDEMEKISCSM